MPLPPPTGPQPRRNGRHHPQPRGKVACRACVVLEQGRKVLLHHLTRGNRSTTPGVGGYQIPQGGGGECEIPGRGDGVGGDQPTGDTAVRYRRGVSEYQISQGGRSNTIGGRRSDTRGSDTRGG